MWRKQYRFMVLLTLCFCLLFGVFQTELSASDSHRTMTNSIGMEFVLVPAGTFTMGSPSDEPQREPDERQYKVTIENPFHFQTTEVTQAQWMKVMGGKPSHFKDCGDDCPVEMVSWNDARDFIRKLNQMESTNKYRLPTEAEWEYACRAGTTTPFFTGNCVSTDQANYDGKKPMPNCPKGESRKRTLRVANFPPNPWVCRICTATSGSGARIGIAGSIQRGMLLIPKDLLRVRSLYCEEVRGSVALG